MIPFLTVHDPEEEVKVAVRPRTNTQYTVTHPVYQAAAYITYAIRSLPATVKTEYFEVLFVRLLHTLAHHPDYSLEETELPDIARLELFCLSRRLLMLILCRYIEFYLDCVANSENSSMLYHLALKLKTVRDAESEEYSEV